MQEIKALGWTHVRVTIYRGMSDREAMAISYETNVQRKNLAFAEKANAMQLAVKDGFTMDEVGVFFGVRRRTVERYLELPKELREHIDGKVVTMAHGRALKPLVDTVTSEVINALIAWIRRTNASEKELKKKLKEDGLATRRGGKQRFGTIKNGTVYGYGFKMGPRSSHGDRQEAIAFLRKAIEKIEGWMMMPQVEVNTRRSCAQENGLSQLRHAVATAGEASRARRLRTGHGDPRPAKRNASRR